MFITTYNVIFTLRQSLEAYATQAEQAELKLELDWASEKSKQRIWVFQTLEGFKIPTLEFLDRPAGVDLMFKASNKAKAKAFAPVRQFLHSIDAVEMYRPPQRPSFWERCSYRFYVKHSGEPWPRGPDDP